MRISVILMHDIERRQFTRIAGLAGKDNENLRKWEEFSATADYAAVTTGISHTLHQCWRQK